MQPENKVQNRGFELPSGFLVVKLNARSSLVEGVEREPKGSKFTTHIHYAIPLEVYQELHRWRARTWKRLKRYKVLDWMGIALYSVKDYDAIKKILDEARKEYEQIIQQIPQEEIRERFYCDPQILVITPPPHYEQSFRRDVSEEMLQQLLKKVEEALNKHYSRDPELIQKFYQVQNTIEALMQKLEEVQSQSLDVQKLVQAMKMSETLREIVTQLTVIRASSRVDKRVIKGVEESMKKIERVQEVLTPEARKLLELAKQHLAAIKAGEVGDINSAVAELERALLGGESR
ncbi:MAG: hypothetical protein JRC86_01535 [Deltaproteobacteria bacterium]|nr:hypothetical protein [Deltaproteobacteria bacterium]